MTRRQIMLGAGAGSAVLGAGLLIGIAEHYAIWNDDDDDDDDGGRDALVRALPFAKITLQQGLIASEQQGQPISGQFEVARGNFQLSVYTSMNETFSEVVVDYSTGDIVKVEPITRADQLAAAQGQIAAMAKAKTSLREAVGTTIGEAPGFRAVRVVPNLKDGRAVASVLLLRGEEFKIVNQALE